MMVSFGRNFFAYSLLLGTQEVRTWGAGVRLWLPQDSGPQLFGTRDQFSGRYLFHGLVCMWEDGFGMIPVHYIYCMLGLYYYYISFASDHQALDPRGGGPLPWRQHLSTCSIQLQMSQTGGVFDFPCSGASRHIERELAQVLGKLPASSTVDGCHLPLASSFVFWRTSQVHDNKLATC